MLAQIPCHRTLPLSLGDGNEKMNRFRKLIGILTALSWVAFVLMDIQFQKVIERAVADRVGTYGEIIGPLSFFRPVSLWVALSLTALALILLAVSGTSARKEDR